MHFFICVIALGGQEHWDNLSKMVVTMEAIEKQSNKKYEQLQQLKITPSNSRVLNEMEDVAR